MTKEDKEELRQLILESKEHLVCPLALTKETAKILNDCAPALQEMANYYVKSTKAVKWFLFTSFVVGIFVMMSIGIYHQCKGFFGNVFGR